MRATQLSCRSGLVAMLSLAAVALSGCGLHLHNPVHAKQANATVEKPVERFGKEAAAFTRKMVEKKRVRLEYDQANAVRGHKDRYGRTLAYVFMEDGRLLNAEIIRQGYGFAYTRFPFERMEEFRRMEREAREQGRGLWAGPQELRMESES